MKIKLKPFQDSFIYSKAEFPAFISGWAGGKTLCGILRAMLYSEHIPNNLGIIFRKEYVDLRDSTVLDFEKYTGLKVDSQRNVEFPNKSKIMFRHIEELNNIQNVNLGWFLIEQVDELESNNEFYMLWGRLRREVEPDSYFKEKGLTFRSGFVIGNVGQQWVKELWKDNRKENYHLSEATTFDNEDVLPEDFIKRCKELETEKPDIYRRYVLNDWSIEDDAFIVIPSRYVEELKTVNIYEVIKGSVISCDPSTGGDECVIYILKNNQIYEAKYLYERDTMKIVGELMLLSAKWDIDNFSIDTIGIGQGIVDRLRELKKNVWAINSAESALNKTQYYNKRSEMWFYLLRLILDKQVHYPKDEELRRQLSSVKYKVINSNGLVQLEPKQETKKRLGRSPDRADSLVYGIWANQFMCGDEVALKPYRCPIGVSIT
ncbi:MAG: hypothetical protein FJ150_02780 [Euryarchaeota archaeon]|nr:hypothetical protein [Euryarchaeota archaeon]